MAQWIELPLVNGGLEPPFSDRPDPNEGGPNVGEVSVADGWEPFCRAKQPGDAPEVNKRPEWTHNAERSAQKVFTTWGTNSSGIFQQVDVPVGTKLKLRVDAMYSDNGSGVALQVGIDPKGGTDVTAVPQEYWSRWHGSTPATGDPGKWPDQAETRTIILDGIVSEQQAVTLFLKMENVHPGKDASAFWKSVRLYGWTEVGPEPPTPPPAPVGGLDDVVAALEDIVATLEEIRDRL
jgi:hypothetical protein